jgi:hypothetical protein
MTENLLSAHLPAYRVNRLLPATGVELRNVSAVISLLLRCTGTLFPAFSESYRSLMWGPLVTTAWRVPGCGWRDRLHLWSVVANTLNKQPKASYKGRLLSLGVGRVDKMHECKK